MRIKWTTLVVLLTLVTAACAEDGGGLGRVAEAATQTTEAQTARFSIATELREAPDEQVAAMSATSGEGELDFANNRGRLTMELPEMTAPEAQSPDATEDPAAAQMPESLEVVFDDKIVYSQIPTAEGIRWLRIDVEEITGNLPDAPQGPDNPTAGLELLRGAEDVEEVGEEDVRGAATTHYRATIDLEQARDEAPEELREQLDRTIEQLGTSQMPIEVWLDEDGRVRRLRQEIDLAQMQQPQVAPTGGDGSGQAATDAQAAQVGGVLVTTTEYYDFGVDVQVEPPPEEEVITVEELQQQGMGGLGAPGGAQGTPASPAPSPAGTET